MKKQFTSRKQILIAINAALLAIFLASGRADAQFVYNGQAPSDQVKVRSAPGTTNTLTASGTFWGSFADGGLGLTEVTIDHGATISSAFPVIQFGQDGGGGMITNEGTLSQISQFAGSDLTTVHIGTGDSLLKLSSYGAINASDVGPFTFNPATVYAVNAFSLGGAITLTNARGATITASGYDAAIALSASGRGGAVTIENGGSISASGNYSGAAEGVVASNSGGDITLSNTGAISGSGYVYFLDSTGVSARISGAGNLSINNSGSLASSASGFYGVSVGVTCSTGSGNITAVNAGSISASGYVAEALTGSSGGSFSLMNSGSLDAQGSYEGQEGFGPVGPAVGAGISAVGAISLSNTGSITNSASSYAAVNAYGIQAQSSSGVVSINNASSVSCTDYIFGNTYGISATNSGAGLSIRNSGGISSNAAVGVAAGIDASTTGSGAGGGKSKISNMGTISASSYYSNVTGIQALGSATPTEIENGPAGLVQVSGPSSITAGILIENSSGDDFMTNAGSIESSGVGVEDVGKGNITFNENGGSISSRAGYKSIVLGTGKNTVNIDGSSRISGVIDGGSAHLANTLNFSNIETTAAQRAAFRTIRAEAATNPTGTYSVKLGHETYTFTDFNLVNGAPSQE